MGLFLGNKKYSKIQVKIRALLQSKSVTPSTAEQTVVPDSSYDGLSSVKVGAIPSSYVQPSGTRIITSNGTYDVKNYTTATVNVASSGGSTTMCSGTLTTSGYTYLIYYSNGSSVKYADLNGSLSISVPIGSIVAVYSSWGEISERSLSNANLIMTSYNCDSCGTCVTLYEVTGSNFTIGLY